MEVKTIEVKTRIIDTFAILLMQDLSRLLLALLVKSTLPKGESKKCLKLCLRKTRKTISVIKILPRKM